MPNLAPSFGGAGIRRNNLMQAAIRFGISQCMGKSAHSTSDSFISAELLVEIE
jgi:hypothetical protein